MRKIKIQYFLWLLISLIGLMGCKLENSYENTFSEEKIEEPKKKIVSEIPSFINNSIYWKDDIFLITDYSYTPPRDGYIEQIHVEVKDKNILINLINGKDLLPIKHKILSSNFYEITEEGGWESKKIAVFKTDKGEVQIFKEGYNDFNFYIKSGNIEIGFTYKFNAQTLKEESLF